MHARSLTRVGAIVALTIVVSAVTAAPAASENVAPAGAQSASVNRSLAALDASGDVVVARDISFPQCTGSLPARAERRFRCARDEQRSLVHPQPVPRPTAERGRSDFRSRPRSTRTPATPVPSAPSTGRSGKRGRGCARHPIRTRSAVPTTTAGTRHGSRTPSRSTRRSACITSNGGMPRHRAANVEWWLDVETMNSWQTLDGPPTLAAQRRDVATIQGRGRGAARRGRRIRGDLLDLVPMEAHHRRLRRSRRAASRGCRNGSRVTSRTRRR